MIFEIELYISEDHDFLEDQIEIATDFTTLVQSFILISRENSVSG